MSVESARQYIVAHKRTISSVLLVLVACYFLYWFRLGSLMPGAAALEVATKSAASLSSIWHDPLNAPYDMLSYLLARIDGHSLFWARAASALLATLAGVVFFFVVKRWHGKQVAVMSAALFAASGWLLHVGHLATPAITLLILPLLLFWLADRFKHSTNHYNELMLGAGLIVGLLLYTPAAIYFIAVAIVINWPYVVSAAKQANEWAAATAIFVPILALASLALSMYQQTGLIRQWLGLASLPHTVVDFLQNWANSLVYLFARGPKEPVFWLGRLPLLDVFSAIMIIVGVVFYVRQRGHSHGHRLKLIVGFALLASLLMAVGNSLYISSLVPLAYMILTTGIAYLLHEWYKVFPRNSLARNTGLTLITLAVAVAITYHVTSYFIAWRHNDAAVQQFRHTIDS